MRMEIDSGGNESSQNVILMMIPLLSKYVAHYLALLHTTLFWGMLYGTDLSSYNFFCDVIIAFILVLPRM